MLQPWPCSIYWNTLCDAPCECCRNCPAQSTHRQIDCIIEGKTMEWIQRQKEEMDWGGAWHIKIEHANKLKYHMSDIYVTYACLPACVRSSRLIYGPSCWSVLCIFPRERDRERERWGARETAWARTFCHVVYFVYKRVPLTYFVPHNERSWWPLINYITHKSALHTHKYANIHTHTPVHTRTHA